MCRAEEGMGHESNRASPRGTGFEFNVFDRSGFSPAYSIFILCATQTSRKSVSHNSTREAPKQGLTNCSGSYFPSRLTKTQITLFEHFELLPSDLARPLAPQDSIHSAKGRQTNTLGAPCAHASLGGIASAACEKQQTGQQRHS